MSFRSRVKSKVTKRKPSLNPKAYGYVPRVSAKVKVEKVEKSDD